MVVVYGVCYCPYVHRMGAVRESKGLTMCASDIDQQVNAA